MPVRRPNFFLVGAPRCGTTTLYGYLDHHPQIFMPPVKEPHFFCRDLREECDRYHGKETYFPFRTLEQYLTLFEGAGDEPVVGDASVYYLLSRTAPGEIRAFDPAAKILVMLREPLSFLQSLHQKLRLMGDEDAGFERALQLEERRQRGEAIPVGVRLPSFLHYAAAARFADHVRRYREVFPAAQIKVVLLDDFMADTQAVLGEVLEFLGVEARSLPEPATRNANREPRSRRLTLWGRALELKHMALSRIPAPEGRKLSKRLQRAALAHFGGLVSRLNSRPAQRRPLDDKVRARLRAQLRPGVEDLGQILGRDLMALWGY